MLLFRFAEFWCYMQGRVSGPDFLELGHPRAREHMNQGCRTMMLAFALAETAFHTEEI